MIDLGKLEFCVREDLNKVAERRMAVLNPLKVVIDLQRQQGFDLERYAGKRAKRYTYEILNYPSGETGVQANLLLYKTTVIGGEVLSPRLDGFLHGLSMPEDGG